MMRSFKEYISGAPSTSVINDVSNYVKQSSVSLSPIDSFYTDRNNLVISMTPTIIESHPSLSPLALVGLISITENYFRNLLSELIRICPLAKELSAERTLNLASIWFGNANVERGAFEGVSFSSTEEIKKNIKKILNFDVEKVGDLDTPLNHFAQLCELRHSIVHSAGILSGRNAIKLHLPASKDDLKIVVGYDEFQEAVGVCTSLVQAINHQLFDEMVKRWLHRWPQTPVYRGADKLKLFRLVWNAFISKQDQQQGRTNGSLTALRLKRLIDQELSDNDSD